MSNGTIVVLGDISTIVVIRVAGQFGWEVAHVDSFEQLEQIKTQREIVAVLFHANDATWRTALERVLDAASTALPIVCHRFSDNVDWPQLADAGAFHSVSLPLDDSELTQSLGFVCARKGMKIDRTGIFERKFMVQSQERVSNSAHDLRALAHAQ